MAQVFSPDGQLLGISQGGSGMNHPGLVLAAGNQIGLEKRFGWPGRGGGEGETLD